MSVQINTYSIEGIIGHLSKVIPNQKDEYFLNSLRRQTKKGLALTDRQFKAAVDIIERNRDLLLSKDPDLSETNLCLGIRSVDREKSIRLVSFPGGKKLIALKFLFNKKLMKIIDKLKKIREHYYDGSVHYFPFTPKNVYLIVSNLRGFNFSIDPELEEIYQIAKHMEEHPSLYLPVIEDFSLKNIKDSARLALEDMFGPVSIDNLIKYADRKLMFGITNISRADLIRAYRHSDQYSSLAVGIASRNSIQIHVDPTDFPIEQLFKALHELNRFPILIVNAVDDNLLQLSTIWNAASKYIRPEEMSITYRPPNDTTDAQEFNRYIKETGIGGKVTQNTKLVMTKNTKLPQPMFVAGWKPNVTILPYSTRCSSQINIFVNDGDLVIHYDTTVTSWWGHLQKIKGIDAELQVDNTG